MSKTILTLLLALAVVSARAQSGVETERKYLSGHGCDDMVQWDFYCTGAGISANGPR